ncbi:uncharacterized protein LOC130625837 [Hydractinia symbiolongicarpus]|uniref:uncharacterized protein LOC130625837 n=1 Tax=Hydractinia symbiolongicarpus TaxID=13093 RepID=UPI0025516858|nr:uncharacterized protein LOC130625837 [Hydractinia symbiolongicarpus]
MAKIHSPQFKSKNVLLIHYLGVIQTIIGILVLLCGVSGTKHIVVHDQLSDTSAVVAGGLRILLTGFFGIMFAEHTKMNDLKKNHFEFCFVSAVFALLSCIFFAVGLSKPCGEEALQCTNCCSRQIGIHVYVLVMTLMIAELVLTFVATILCYKALGRWWNAQIEEVSEHKMDQFVVNQIA